MRKEKTNCRERKRRKERMLRMLLLSHWNFITFEWRRKFLRFNIFLFCPRGPFILMSLHILPRASESNIASKFQSTKKDTTMSGLRLPSTVTSGTSSLPTTGPLRASMSQRGKKTMLSALRPSYNYLLSQPPVRNHMLVRKLDQDLSALRDCNNGLIIRLREQSMAIEAYRLLISQCPDCSTRFLRMSAATSSAESYIDGVEKAAVVAVHDMAIAVKVLDPVNSFEPAPRMTAAARKAYPMPDADLASIGYPSSSSEGQPSKSEVPETQVSEHQPPMNQSSGLITTTASPPPYSSAAATSTMANAFSQWNRDASVLQPLAISTASTAPGLAPESAYKPSVNPSYNYYGEANCYNYYPQQ